MMILVRYATFLSDDIWSMFLTIKNVKILCGESFQAINLIGFAVLGGCSNLLVISSKPRL